MNAQKPRGREGIVSTRIFFYLVPVLILLPSSLAQTLDDWDIYSDTDIIDGQYNLINIYDTPPDNTTVNMYGGSADFISTFDSSTLNFSNGNAQVGAFETSIINISGGVLSGARASDNSFVYFSGSASSTSLGASKWGQAYLLDGIVDHIGVSDYGVVNLHGGMVIDFIGAYDSSVVNLFGYNLTKTSLGGSYDNGLITGLWLDGSVFSIDLYGSETHDHINLIPELSTFILLTLGFLGIRRRKIMKLIKKNVGDASVTLRISLFFVLYTILFSATSQALAGWDIYHDTDIHSGTYGLIDIYDSPPDNTTVNFYGDLADYIGTHDSSTLNFFSGEAEIGAFNKSLVNISGGTLSAVRAWNDVTVNFSASSSASSLSASHSSTVNMNGGSVDHIGSSESGVFNLYGGIIIDRIYATDFSNINIYGYNLNKTYSGGTYGYGQLYGYLMDETYICVDLANPEAYDHINIVPEPSSLLILALGFLRIRRRKIMKIIKKNAGDASVTLRISLFFVLYTILFAATSQALAGWDIYHDTDIHSGTYGLIDIYDSPLDNTTVNFYGDLADYIGTHDSSTLNFFSGEAELQAMDTSTMNISGGTLSFAEARYESKINVSGLANIGSLRAEDFSEIIVTGGSISAMGAKNSGIINLYGGELIEGIHATDSGQINVYGHDLVKTTSGGYYGYGQLYGYLTDETYICVDIFDLETHDHIYLIPEPSTFVLFGIVSLVLFRKSNSKIAR